MTGKIKLYDENGWLTLEERRKYQKLVHVLTYKTKNNMVPDSLINLFPSWRRTIPLKFAILDLFCLYSKKNFFIRKVVCTIYHSTMEFSTKSLAAESVFWLYLSVIFTYYISSTDRSRLFYTWQSFRLRNICSYLKCYLFANYVSDSHLCPQRNAPEDGNPYFFTALSK